MIIKSMLIISVLTWVIHAITIDEVLDNMKNNETVNTSRSEMTMTVTDASGRETISEIISYSAEKGEKSLMEYIAPARIKGMKILSLNEGDDIWLFSSRTSRVRKIASNQKRQSVNNSDFSYEDISSNDRREDYMCKFLDEKYVNDVECYTIEMIPKRDDISYSKVILYVDKKTYLPTEGFYFDEDGNLWKKLYMKNPSKNGKYWRAELIEMHNVLKGSKTVMKIKKIVFDIEFDQNMFSERSLKR